MNIDISLPVLILGEIIFALFVALFFTVRHIAKQHAQIKKLLAKFQELKSAYAHPDYQPASFYDNKNPIENRDIINTYFESALADSLQRYEKYTNSSSPHINADYPFSGKIAALRSIYLAAEKEVFDERGITHAGWGTFEKRLADLVRWQGQKNSHRQEVRDNRSRLLQAEVTRLKNYQRELEQYQRDSQKTINSLHTMLENLKNFHVEPTLSSQTPTNDLWDEQSLNKFVDDSGERNRNMLELLHELKNYPSQFSSSVRKKMEDQLNILEIELIKSDQHIGNLRRELKEAKLQVTNYAIMLRDATANDPINQSGIGSNQAEKIEADETPGILNEIQRLKTHNKRQRFIINELEQEIQSLRHSLDTTSSTDERESKEKEIHRLERLVKECQACINTLESEVESLYTQLQEKNDLQNDKVQMPADANTNEELDMVTRELEKTVAHYQQLHAINYLMMDFMRCNSIEQLARQFVQFIKAFKACIGFIIYSSLGKAEYFPALHFKESLKSLIKSANFTDPITHLDEGTIFINSKVHALLLPPTGDSHPILETSLAGLINAAEEGIKRIESEKSIEKRAQENHEWTSGIKNLLSDLDIQYAYQMEENRKTFNHFIAELRRAYHLLDLQGPGAVILDNAINEFEERMHALIHSGEAIDNEISRLLEHMGMLRTG